MKLRKTSFALATVVAALTGASAFGSASASSELEVSDDGAILVRAPAPNQLEPADGNPRKAGPELSRDVYSRRSSRDGEVDLGVKSRPVPGGYRNGSASGNPLEFPASLPHAVPRSSPGIPQAVPPSKMNRGRMGRR